jgi:hypothetical protein
MQAVGLTRAPEAATLFLLGDWAISSFSVPSKARELAGRLFFCVLNAPYLTQPLRASQRNYQT